MERKHIPETENRLMILYTLRQLGPGTATQLLQAMAEGDLMNYITMQLADLPAGPPPGQPDRNHQRGRLYPPQLRKAHPRQPPQHRGRAGP